MFNIHPLYSSSSGNLFHLGSDKADILIDAGVSYKAINEGLNLIGKSIKEISAVIVTHEHSDHIKGLPLLCRKHDIPIYACGNTADHIRGLLTEKNIPSNINQINYGQPFKIKDLDITAFETSHDACMPCGFKIQNKDLKLGYATDLGYVSDDVLEHLQDCNWVVIESNYDNTMLDYGKYPFPLKRRIKSVTGHLSNEDSANAIVKLAKSGNDKFLLAHLSENNNQSEIAKNTVLDSFLKHNIDASNISLNVASKTLTDEVYSIC